MAEPSSKLLESRLLYELSTINRQIEELQAEKHGLERLIVRIRREDVANREVGRRNSARRILVEKAVIDRLIEAKGKTVSSGELYRAASEIEFNLKESTFRSHLHRMRMKGMIQRAGPLAGRYRLPSRESDQQE